MEQNQKQKKLVQGLVYGGILIAAILIFASIEGIFSLRDPKEILGVLSDACFVPGVLFTGVGAFSWISSKGGYDAFGYAFSSFSLHNLFPTKQPKKYKSLYDYKQEKDEKGRKWLPELLIIGLISLVLGALFLVLYFI